MRPRLVATKGESKGAGSPLERLPDASHYTRPEDRAPYVALRRSEGQELEVKRMLEPTVGRYTVEAAIPGIAHAGDMVIVSSSLPM